MGLACRLPLHPALLLAALCGGACSGGPDAESEALWQKATARYQRGDHAGAARLLRDAAERGHVLAQGQLGYQYEAGDGLPRDPRQAAAWYRKAAEQGDSFGLHHLGVLYRDGRGVDQSYATAMTLFGQSADRGLPDADYAIGNMYECGLGVPRDSGAALARYRKAAEKGHARAAQAVRWMAQPGNVTFCSVAERDAYLRNQQSQVIEGFKRHDERERERRRREGR